MNDRQQGQSANHEQKSWIIGLIGVIVGIVIQFGAGIYWAGRISESMNNFDKRLGTVDIQNLEQRVARIEGAISSNNQNEVSRAERLAKVEQQSNDILTQIGKTMASVAAIETSLKDRMHR